MPSSDAEIRRIRWIAVWTAIAIAAFARVYCLAPVVTPFFLPIGLITGLLLAQPAGAVRPVALRRLRPRCTESSLYPGRT